MALLGAHVNCVVCSAQRSQDKGAAGSGGEGIMGWELVRVPLPDTLAAVHRSLAMRLRTSDLSNSVEAARGAWQAGPSSPSPSPPKVR